MIPIPYQAIVALVLLLGGAGGGFYAGLRWDKADLIQAQANYATAKANADTLGQAVAQCNLSVDGIAKAGKSLTDAAQSLIDQAKKESADSAAAIRAMNAVKSTDEKCPVADSIIQRGLE